MREAEKMDVLEAYVAARARFGRLAMVTSGTVLLIAGVSRLPTWEVESPVSWLAGSINVGFLPIFGPIFILGAFCNVYLALRELLNLRAAAQHEIKEPSEHIEVLLSPPRGSHGHQDPRQAIAAFVLRFWNFCVPLLAYLILISTYFDFVRPISNDDPKPVYETRSGQIADLLIGKGSWKGFRPALPSITANLSERKAASKDAKEAARLAQLSRSIPWIYPPFQTWAYIFGFILLGYMAWGA